MKTLLLLISILIVSSFAAECGVQTDCDACTQVPGCGWCAPTQQCLKGNTTGPNSSVCIGDNWEFGKCTPCSKFSNCRACLSRDTDCFWCSNGYGACNPIGFTGCTYTKSCPCDIYSSCTECANDVGCQWCGAGDNCVRMNETCTGPQPVYNYTTQCPCNANHDCPNCRLTDGCDWCQTGACANKGNCTNTILNCQYYCNNIASTCDTCVAYEGCAWCGLTQLCVDRATSSCPFTYDCPVCAAASYCDTCLSINDCVWCGDKQECHPQGTNCFLAHSCPNYCSTYLSCDVCSAARGCGWCDDSQTCADVSVTSCFYAHTCSSSGIVVKKCGFNGAAFVGGMFLVIGIAVLAVGGYIFYRWKTGRKFDYRELK